MRDAPWEVYKSETRHRVQREVAKPGYLIEHTGKQIEELEQKGELEIADRGAHVLVPDSAPWQRKVATNELFPSRSFVPFPSLCMCRLRNEQSQRSSVLSLICHICTSLFIPEASPKAASCSASHTKANTDYPAVSRSNTPDLRMWSGEGSNTQTLNLDYLFPYEIFALNLPQQYLSTTERGCDMTVTQ
ncbi:uncharacterized protein BDR25DRAFT_351498 [Lindgomyces ingoldianus]|uniref:Uncharacterized protein n=1 Tax=Lindgomyces ingoldianus TaxID=673940 RepID=A0ACB6R769_9PLEO|nr:uncharacterized protein BDR25DRAFT_351498 [Lindgomyces ingoldianus]KAF2475016.1 hypothetical protein BDR25DRAFT_351498 [Lindgomyces ingoldianus]